MKLASYKAADRARLEAFLRRQQTFAALSGQTIDAFSEENVADFEADGTISLLVEADAEVIAVVDLLRRHPVDGSLCSSSTNDATATESHNRFMNNLSKSRCFLFTRYSGSASCHIMNGRIVFGNAKAMCTRKSP